MDGEKESEEKTTTSEDKEVCATNEIDACSIRF